MRGSSPRQGVTRPADSVRLANGDVCFLAPLAHETARRHWDEYPDEADRYGERGFEWCVHDTQYLFWWASLDTRLGGSILSRQVAWLARVLASRGYPVERLARSLDLAGDVLAERHGEAADDVVEALRGEARSLAAKRRRS